MTDISINTQVPLLYSLITIPCIFETIYWSILGSSKHSRALAIYYSVWMVPVPLMMGFNFVISTSISVDLLPYSVMPYEILFFGEDWLDRNNRINSRSIFRNFPLIGVLSVLINIWLGQRLGYFSCMHLHLLSSVVFMLLCILVDIYASVIRLSYLNLLVFWLLISKLGKTMVDQSVFGCLWSWLLLTCRSINVIF